MTEPIFDPHYWRRRAARAWVDERPHKALWNGPTGRWREIAECHRRILAHHIEAPDASVLDAGCAWGRLLGLMPAPWNGPYIGIDLSPDFIAQARLAHPPRESMTVREFYVADLRSFCPKDLRPVPALRWPADWAVCISIKPMIVANAGAGVWDGIERGLRRAARRVLLLEYDEDHTGEVLE